MKTLPGPVFLFLALLIPTLISPYQMTSANHISQSATPTYDPFAEPPLPENPTEYELGRNLYWHWCMTCHGDRGQGLTDEFRLIWEPDHQDCWGRGCHGGRLEDEGFPIPTVVPALVNDAHLAQFAAVQDLSNFLKATHPPQSPGILKQEEYDAIAAFVFTLNTRPVARIPATEPAVPSATPSPAAEQSMEPARFAAGVVMFLVLIAAGGWVLITRARPNT